MNKYMLSFKYHNLNDHDEIANQFSEKALTQLFNHPAAGFLSLTDANPLWEQIQNHIKNLIFDQLVVIGIGGSHLGTQVLSRLLDNADQLFLLDNPDPVRYQHFLRWVKNWHKLHIIIISKKELGNSININTQCQKLNISVKFID